MTRILLFIMLLATTVLMSSFVIHALGLSVFTEETCRILTYIHLYSGSTLCITACLMAMITCPLLKK